MNDTPKVPGTVADSGLPSDNSHGIETSDLFLDPSMATVHVSLIQSRQGREMPGLVDRYDLLASLLCEV